MSVYKSRRKDAVAEFIADARELRKVTMRVVKRFPTSYRWIITNNLCTLKTEKTNTGWVYTRRSKGRKETVWNTSHIAA